MRSRILPVLSTGSVQCTTSATSSLSRARTSTRHIWTTIARLSSRLQTRSPALSLTRSYLLNVLSTFMRKTDALLYYILLSELVRAISKSNEMLIGNLRRGVVERENLNMSIHVAKHVLVLIETVYRLIGKYDLLSTATSCRLVN